MIMPGVSFDPRGVSEYDRNFKWTGENVGGVPIAGKQSSKMLQCNEPPLQHKRRIIPHQDNKIMNEDLSARSQENNVRSEILLGGKKNQKFGPSVVHVMKSKVRPREQDENGPPPLPTDLRLPREASRDADDLQPYPVDFVMERPSPPKFSESSPRPSDTPPRRHKKREQRRQTRKPQKERRKEAVRFETMQKNNNRSSNLVPPENYAKQHQLGLKHAWRETKANHLTEYGRQFEWRPTDHQSPILKAEDVIFRSHLDMPKEAKVSDTTEYRRQFKPFRYNPVPKTTDSSETVDEKVAHKVDKALRSQPAAPVPRVVVEGKTFTPSEVLNPQRMSFPLGRQRNYLSEYNANFRSFVGERSPAPAHLLAGESSPIQERDVNKMWFEEILELRRRAEEYKLRARGTHFSRDHVAKIIGRPSVSPVQHEAVMDGDAEDEDGERTPRNEADERLATAHAQRPVGRHHLARTTPCSGGVILSPETAQPQTDRTETSLVVGKARSLSRTDNPALRLAGQQETFSGLKPASSGYGAFQTAGKPTVDTDQLQETWAEPRRDDVIYEGFGETYNVSQPEEEVKDFDNEEEEEDASTMSHVSIGQNGGSVTSDQRVASNGSGRKKESIASGRSITSSRSSIRVWTPPLPPKGLARPPIDDDVASTLESVRSIVSSSSQLAEETLERARRNQERTWNDKR